MNEPVTKLDTRYSDAMEADASHAPVGRILPVKMPAYQQGAFTEMTPADIQELKTYSEQHRPAGTPFDIVIEGETPGDDPIAATNQLQPFAQAGVTWWIEAVWATPETQGGVEGMKKRIQQGPLRVGSRASKGGEK